MAAILSAHDNRLDDIIRLRMPGQAGMVAPFAFKASSADKRAAAYTYPPVILLQKRMLCGAQHSVIANMNIGGQKSCDLNL